MTSTTSDATAAATATRRAALEVVLERRSTAALNEPAPAGDDLDLILRAAATVPDHGSLQPWRLVVVEGEHRATFAEALARSAAELNPGIPDDKLEKMRRKAYVAPLQILIIASPVDSPKVAEWEQIASASCTGFAIALAAHALGYGAMWKSVPFTRGVGIVEALDLGEREQLLGWVNVGTTGPELPTRQDPDPDTYTQALTTSGLRPLT
jgi:nitroreductase